MARNKKFEGDMMAIGETRAPQFCRLPNIHHLFDERRKRFDILAPTNPVGAYIRFLSAVTKAQHDVAQVMETRVDRKSETRVDRKSETRADDEENMERALRFAMPVIDRNRLIESTQFHDVADDIFARFEMDDLPAAAREALDYVKKERDIRREFARNLVKGVIEPHEKLGGHIFVMAALQVLFAAHAAQLDASRLKPLESNLCPACGGTHHATTVVGWSEADGTRYCSCLYCGTMWNYVRIKCTFCAATGGIGYREIEGGPGTIQAETCKTCNRYCKLVDQQKDAGFDVFADDVGSIALDLLMQQDGTFTRGTFNPFMAGF